MDLMHEPPELTRAPGAERKWSATVVTISVLAFCSLTVVVLAGLRVQECEGCVGLGRITYGEWSDFRKEVFFPKLPCVDNPARGDVYWTCLECSGSGRVSLCRKWSRHEAIEAADSENPARMSNLLVVREMRAKISRGSGASP